jgi:1-aminocyclopropane-1-carboxylate deaminase
MMSFSLFQKSRIDMLPASHQYPAIDVLRLDLLHPVISGNKWFKLKEYIKDAISLEKKIIATWGGAYSNHIVATAAAAKEFGLSSIGIIRGEQPSALSHTLQEAINFGMELFFVSRAAYQEKKIPAALLEKLKEEPVYLISEGGYGILGRKGAEAIAGEVNYSSYTHVIAATGTGTMIAGLTAASGNDQKIIGVSVLKNNFSITQEIQDLLPPEKQDQFTVLHEYHFGGYAKHSRLLIDFMNEWYATTEIPSDFVYTGKLFYAVNDLIQKKYFPDGSRLLVIHSGGLQGNRSLPKGTLIF